MPRTGGGEDRTARPSSFSGNHLRGQIVTKVSEVAGHAGRGPAGDAGAGQDRAVPGPDDPRLPRPRRAYQLPVLMCGDGREPTDAQIDIAADAQIRAVDVSMALTQIMTVQPPRHQIRRQFRRIGAHRFADAVRRHRCIGACYGAPGIGKTLSARTYAAADDRDRWAEDRFTRSAVLLPPALLASRTVMLTPGVTTTPRDLEAQIYTGCGALGADIAPLASDVIEQRERLDVGQWRQFGWHDGVTICEQMREKVVVAPRAGRLLKRSRP